MIAAIYNFALLFQQKLPGDEKPASENLSGATDFDIWPAFINMVFVLSLVVGLIFFLSWLFRKMAGKSMSFGSSGFMKVVSTLPLGEKRVLTVVRVGTRYFLMGITQNNINNLAELKEDEVKDVLENQSQGEGSFARILQKISNNKDKVPQ